MELAVTESRAIFMRSTAIPHFPRVLKLLGEKILINQKDKITKSNLSSLMLTWYCFMAFEQVEIMASEYEENKVTLNYSPK